jgi:hypothetical protein
MIRFIDFAPFANDSISLSNLFKLSDGLFKPHNLLSLLLPSELFLSKLLL